MSGACEGRCDGHEGDPRGVSRAWVATMKETSPLFLVSCLRVGADVAIADHDGATPVHADLSVFRVRDKVPRILI